MLFRSAHSKSERFEKLDPVKDSSGHSLLLLAIKAVELWDKYSQSGTLVLVLTYRANIGLPQHSLLPPKEATLHSSRQRLRSNKEIRTMEGSVSERSHRERELPT